MSAGTEITRGSQVLFMSKAFSSWGPDSPGGASEHSLPPCFQRGAHLPLEDKDFSGLIPKAALQPPPGSHGASRGQEKDSHSVATSGLHLKVSPCGSRQLELGCVPR